MTETTANQNHAVKTEKEESEESVAAVTQPTKNCDGTPSTTNHCISINCYRSSGPNYFAKDYQYQHKETHGLVQKAHTDV